MSAPQTYQIKVKGMTCQHCVKAVTKAVQGLDADAKLAVDLASGLVSVETALSRKDVVKAIDEEGYEVTS